MLLAFLGVHVADRSLAAVGEVENVELVTIRAVTTLGGFLKEAQHKSRVRLPDKREQTLVERGGSIAAGIRHAQEVGVLEPDPELDLSGADAATKLAAVTRISWLLPLRLFLRGTRNWHNFLKCP